MIGIGQEIIIAAFLYVSSMWSNISKSLAILWKVFWARQTSGYLGSGCAKCGWNSDSILNSGGHSFTVLSILSSKDMYYELNATIYIYAAICTHKNLILDLSSSLFWYSWSFHLLGLLVKGYARKKYYTQGQNFSLSLWDPSPPPTLLSRALYASKYLRQQ